MRRSSCWSNLHLFLTRVFGLETSEVFRCRRNFSSVHPSVFRLDELTLLAKVQQVFGLSKAKSIKIRILNRNEQSHGLSNQRTDLGFFEFHVMLNAVDMNWLTVIEMKPFFKMCLTPTIFDKPMRKVGLKPLLSGFVFYNFINANGNFDLAAIRVTVQL